jgi:hypothetical protein
VENPFIQETEQTADPYILQTTQQRIVGVKVFRTFDSCIAWRLEMSHGPDSSVANINSPVTLNLRGFDSERS